MRAILKHPFEIVRSTMRETVSQLWRWFPRLTGLMSMEAIVQIASLLTSLLVIRFLPKQDYAWYSIGNSLQGSLAIFSLTGVGTGLIPLAANTKTPTELANVISSAFRLRMILSAMGCLVAMPIFCTMLYDLECPWMTGCCLIAMAILSLFAAAKRQMIALPFSLRGMYFFPQLENLLTSVIRTCLTLAVIAAGLANSVSIMFVAICSALLGLSYLQSNVCRVAVTKGKSKNEVSQKLLRHFWVGLPSSLTYLLESQIVLFLIAILGGSNEVADLNAITRLALIFALPTALINSVLVPRLSRETNLARLGQYWISSIAIAFGIASAICVSVYLLSHQILWFFGPQYAQLSMELIAMAILQGFIFVVNVMQVPVVARGWVRATWARPFFCFGAQAITLFFVDVSTVIGAISLMAAGAIGNTVLNCFLLHQGWQGKGSLTSV